MSDRQRLAGVQLRTAIAERQREQITLSQFLHICRDACLTAQRDDLATWFWQETVGFGTNVELPEHRRSNHGVRELQAENPALKDPDSPLRRVYEIAGTIHPLIDQPGQTVFMPIRWGVSDLVNWSGAGNFEPVSDWERLQSPTMSTVGSMSYRWIVRYPADTFRRLLANIDAAAQVKARRIEIDLIYGDTVQDIWEEFREITEPSLAALGLENHFQVIRDGIRGDNPEGWRAAMYECRSILEHLSEMLWRDPRSRHPCLTNHEGKALDVGDGKTKNRLMAYLHCNGTKDNEKQAVEADLEAVLSSVRSLYDLDSTAHKPKPVDRNDARLAVIQTYIFLGQLVQRTDLVPIEAANECCNATVKP